jgi:HSP20 family protein
MKRNLFLDGLLYDVFGAADSIRVPIGIRKSDDGYIVRCELPGVPKDKIKVDVDNDILTISGYKEQDDLKWEHSEIYFGNFSRKINLGSGVDTSLINATYVDGVLEIKIGLKPEKKAISIDIT